MYDDISQNIHYYINFTLLLKIPGSVLGGKGRDLTPPTKLQFGVKPVMKNYKIKIDECMLLPYSI